MRMKTVEDKLKEVLGNEFKLYRNSSNVIIGKITDNGRGIKNCKYFRNFTEAYRYLDVYASKEDFN